MSSDANALMDLADSDSGSENNDEDGSDTEDEDSDNESCFGTMPVPNEESHDVYRSDRDLNPDVLAVLDPSDLVESGEENEESNSNPSSVQDQVQTDTPAVNSGSAKGRSIAHDHLNDKKAYLIHLDRKKMQSGLE